MFAVVTISSVNDILYTLSYKKKICMEYWNIYFYATLNRLRLENPIYFDIFITEKI